MTWFEISITNDALNFQKHVSFFIGPLSLHNIKTVLFDLVMSQNHNKLEHNILLLCLESEIAYNHYWLRCSLLTVYVLHCSQISLRLIVVCCLIFFSVLSLQILVFRKRESGWEENYNCQHFSTWVGTVIPEPFTKPWNSEMKH